MGESSDKESNRAQKKTPTKNTDTGSRKKKHSREDSTEGKASGRQRKRDDSEEKRPSNRQIAVKKRNNENSVEGKASNRQLKRQEDSGEGKPSKRQIQKSAEVDQKSIPVNGKNRPPSPATGEKPVMSVIQTLTQKMGIHDSTDPVRTQQTVYSAETTDKPSTQRRSTRKRNAKDKSLENIGPLGSNRALRTSGEVTNKERKKFNVANLSRENMENQPESNREVGGHTVTPANPGVSMLMDPMSRHRTGDRSMAPTTLGQPGLPGANVCSDTVGYGSAFTNDLLEPAKTFEIKVEPPNKVPLLKVSKTLIVYEIPPQLEHQIETGDILYRFNDFPVTSRETFIQQLSFACHNPHPQNVTYTVLRPIRTRIIPPTQLGTVVPPGFELQPVHFEYLYVYLIVIPKCVLGLTVKAYNGKVYVSGIQNNDKSIVNKCLLVGDAILSLDDNVISGVQSANDMLLQGFTRKKFIKAIVERAKTTPGVRQVKLALSVEKTVEINPRMGDDIIEICQAQLKQMNSSPDVAPTKPLLKTNSSDTNQHLSVNATTVEVPISTDVNNITFLAPTPPPPSVAPGTRGSFDPLGIGLGKSPGSSPAKKFNPFTQYVTMPFRKK